MKSKTLYEIVKMIWGNIIKTMPTVILCLFVYYLSRLSGQPNEYVFVGFLIYTAMNLGRLYEFNEMREVVEKVEAVNKIIRG